MLVAKIEYNYFDILIIFFRNIFHVFAATSTIIKYLNWINIMSNTMHAIQKSINKIDYSNQEKHFGNQATGSKNHKTVESGQKIFSEDTEVSFVCLGCKNDKYRDLTDITAHQAVSVNLENLKCLKNIDTPNAAKFVAINSQDSKDAIFDCLEKNNGHLDNLHLKGTCSWIELQEASRSRPNLEKIINNSNIYIDIRPVGKAQAIISSDRLEKKIEILQHLIDELGLLKGTADEQKIIDKFQNKHIIDISLNAARKCIDFIRGRMPINSFMGSDREILYMVAAENERDPNLNLYVHHYNINCQDDYKAIAALAAKKEDNHSRFLLRRKLPETSDNWWSHHFMCVDIATYKDERPPSLLIFESSPELLDKNLLKTINDQLLCSIKEKTDRSDVSIGWVCLGTQRTPSDCAMFSLFHALKLAKTKFGDKVHNAPQDFKTGKIDGLPENTYVVDNKKVPAIFFKHYQSSNFINQPFSHPNNIHYRCFPKLSERQQAERVNSEKHAKPETLQSRNQEFYVKHNFYDSQWDEMEENKLHASLIGFRLQESIRCIRFLLSQTDEKL